MDYTEIARENIEASNRANEREDDEYVPEDPGGLSFEEPCLVCRLSGYKNCQGHIPTNE